MDLCFLRFFNEDQLLEFQMDVQMTNIFLKGLHIGNQKDQGIGHFAKET